MLSPPNFSHVRLFIALIADDEAASNLELFIRFSPRATN